MSHVQVIDRDGWEKHFQLERRITRIGSAAGCDVVLCAARGTGVAGTHVQLIQPNNAACRMINLSGDEVHIGGLSPVPAHGVVDLKGGEVIHLGEFTLTYVADTLLDTTVEYESQIIEHDTKSIPDIPLKTIAQKGKDQSDATETTAARNIAIDLSLASTRIEPGQTVGGSVTVQNTGASQAVQIQLDAEGLQDCCDVAPGPILFPGASRSVALGITVPESNTIHAGRHRLVVRASAPTAYPGEVAEAAVEVEIAPRYKHMLSWANQNDGGADRG